MAEIAFWEVFVLLSFPTDMNEKRKHIHIYKVNKHSAAFVAKIWLEKNNKKDISVAHYGNTKDAKAFDTKTERELLSKIDEHWDSIMDKINNFFSGKKLVGVINLNK